jgi:hypothetical protein
LALRARKMMPRMWDSTFRALDTLAWAAREISDRKSNPPRRPAGRKLERTTVLLAALDTELDAIAPTRRRRLVASLVTETLGVQVEGAEAVRARIRDFRRKPGRSPRRRDRSR